ncbi:MAG: hypothetical protein MZV64_43205 [Ignavibacteriales bacterium]|nr:hypothetical protein [Ignavibacteriales bacterium]
MPPILRGRVYLRKAARALLLDERDDLGRQREPVRGQRNVVLHLLDRHDPVLPHHRSCGS